MNKKDARKWPCGFRFVGDSVLWCVERAHEDVTDLVTEWKLCIKLTERQKFLKINIILCVKVGGIR